MPDGSDDGGSDGEDDEDRPPREASSRTVAWVLSGGEATTMPGGRDSDVILDPAGMLRSLMAPRGADRDRQGSSQDMTRSMYAQASIIMEARTSNNTRNEEDLDAPLGVTSGAPLGVTSGALRPRGGDGSDDEVGGEGPAAAAAAGLDGGRKGGGYDGDGDDDGQRRSMQRSASLTAAKSKAGSEKDVAKAAKAKAKAKEDGSEMDDDAMSSNLSDYKVGENARVSGREGPQCGRTFPWNGPPHIPLSLWIPPTA